jgi:RNA polymerase sigma-70 factor, ECF subfamily
MKNPNPNTEAAFEEAFRRHFSRVQMIATRFAASECEAEELAQETFLRLHGSPVLDRPEAEVAAWLARVVTNLGLNASRGRRREQARVEKLRNLEMADMSTRTAEADPVKVVVREEEQRLVREVLQQLPDRARTCLILRHSGLSYAEISQVLHVAPGSVGTLLARAELAFTERWKRWTDGM